MSRNTTTATTTPKQHPLLPPDQRLSTRNEQELLYVGLGEQGVLCASMVFWNASFLPPDAVSSSSSVQRQEEKTLSKRQPPARGCRCVSCPLPSSLSHLLTNLPTSQAGDHLLPHFHPSRQPLSITVGKQKVTSVLESAPSKSETKLRGLLPQSLVSHTTLAGTDIVDLDPKGEAKVGGGKEQVQRNDLDVDARRPCTVRERIVCAWISLARRSPGIKKPESRAGLACFISAKAKR